MCYGYTIHLACENRCKEYSQYIFVEKWKKQKGTIYLDTPLIYLSELQILLKFLQVHIAYKQLVFALLHVFN